VELKELLAIIRRQKDPAPGRLIAVELAKNPALLSQQESTFRTVFSHLPPEVFKETVLPARQRLEKLMDAKKRQLGMLADQAAAQGNAEAGKAHFAQGKGTCIACHKIGDAGRAIGPDLSRIGGIRTERDLLESILFPSNTLARDYEAHVFELKGGETAMGVGRSHAAEGLLGLLTAPLLHGSVEHIAANSIALLLLGTLAGTVYPKATVRALPLLWLGSGLGAWLLGQPGPHHLGASGSTHSSGVSGGESTSCRWPFTKSVIISVPPRKKRGEG